MDITSSHSTILDLPPSAVAFCPSLPEYYVVGTYFLHRTAKGEQPSDAPQKRTGALILYRLEETQFTHVQTVPLDSAVLDIEWTPHHSKLGPLLCVATSTGSLEFFAFDASAGKLEQTSSKQISDKEILVLDLLWHPTRADVIAVTLSDGSVSICQSDDSTNPWSSSSQLTTTELTNHSLEPWTLAFSPDTSRLFSGGDDAVLQCMQLSHDSEDPAGEFDTSSTTLWTDRKAHEAGVTAILPLANNLLITGSYDDNVRLIYAPPVGRKQVVAELNLGGGVWRLRMLENGTVSNGADNDRSYTLLASCMHAGSRIVRLERASAADSGDEWTFSVLAKFEEHKSMNYGSDVQPARAGGQEAGKKVVVSTSFYDKLMCVWEF